MLSWFKSNQEEVVPVELSPLDQYIVDMWDGDPLWFMQEVNRRYHTNRIRNVLDIKAYLNGEHEILKREGFIYNGEEYKPKKLVLDYAKNIVNFQTNYLLKMPVTITGKDSVSKKFTKTYKKGKFHRKDLDILSDVINYGDAYEYPYWDKYKKLITSKMIHPENGYPIYNDFSEYVGFIEYFTVEGISYWTVYREDKVEKWTNKGGEIISKSIHPNVGGRLPIHYKSKNDIDRNFGKSEILAWIPIIDTLEELLSKFSDVVFKFCNPVIVISGEFNFEDPIDSSTVGVAIHLQEGSTFEFKQPDVSDAAFKTAYEAVYHALLDISNTPSVIMGNKNLANVAEVTVAMMFQIADIKATLNERMLRDGIEERFEIMRNLMVKNGEQVGEDAYDSLDFVCITDKPKNVKEIVDNLNSAVQSGILSIQSAIEQSPYTKDVQQELDRLDGQVNSNETGNVIKKDGMTIIHKNNSNGVNQDKMGNNLGNNQGGN
ncbi:phage portal protein [Aneurinibacillus tyrosinisolvens]|uniref:phage portal protein n=1 Tax=Aneurinibacillus tyrosinisolvens TaxID=1443435 RepID=UPI0006993C5C|nr:phage portal protein [Aneurinibacillus tyrosinisolvens]